MILSRRAALDGAQLDEIHEAIVIRGIDQGTASESLNAVDRMGGVGQRMTMQHYGTLDVTVTYAIDVPKRNMALRREIMDAVNKWALQKGWLTVNWMEGRRVFVDHVVIPNGGDLWNWTDEYQITFRAYSVPFWQEEKGTKVKTPTAAKGRIWLAINGNVESPLDVEFKNMSGQKIDKFQVSANGKTITLTDLGLGGNSTLHITHGTDGLLQIKAGSTSVYEKYTGDDDIFLLPGNNAIDFSASRAGVLTASNIGRWI